MKEVSIIVINVVSTKNHIESHHVHSKQQVLTFIFVQYKYRMECVSKRGEYYGNQCLEYQQSY